MSEENPLGSDGLHGFYAVDVSGSITLLADSPLFREVWHETLQASGEPAADEPRGG